MDSAVETIMTLRRGAALVLRKRGLRSRILRQTSFPGGPFHTDIGVTLFTFLTVYLLWEYISQTPWLLLMATGLAFGLALPRSFRR
jgi:hypothetical protein